MNPSDNSVAKALAVTAEYYGKVLSPATLQQMRHDLAKYPQAMVLDAIASHRKNPERGRFFPLTADLMVYLTGTDESVAKGRWDFALRCAARIGIYQSVAFPDEPALMAAISYMGGWRGLCLISSEELPFRERDFVARYVDFMHIAPLNPPEYLQGLNTDGLVRSIRADGTSSAAPALTYQGNASALESIRQRALTMQPEHQP